MSLLQKKKLSTTSISPSIETVNAFPVLSAALVCAISSGTVYYWPAITPGLQYYLNVTPFQAGVLIAIANSGNTLGIPSGLLHSRIGSRQTTLIGTLSASLIYAILALLIIFRPVSPLLFPILIILVCGLIMANYMAFSATITTCSSVFPEHFRGRILGLISICYGASAAFFSTFQAAFFPALRHTASLLLFISVFLLLAFTGVVLTFPKCSYFEPLSPFDASKPTLYGTTPSVKPLSSQNQTVSYAIRNAYIISCALTCCLQVAAIFPLFNSSQNVQAFLALLLAALLLAFQFVRSSPPLVVCEKPQQEASISPDDPFWNIFLDRRALFIGGGCLFLISGGGITVLVQARNIAISRVFREQMPSQSLDPEMIASMERTIVMVFSSCSVAARLVVGSITDMGSTDMERLMWKYDMMCGDFLMMGVALTIISFSRFYFIYVGVALVGFSFGSYFTKAPALVTLWFGVQKFPRNFAVLGVFMTVGTAVFSSAVPSWLMGRFGEWVDVAVVGGGREKVCAGLMCTIPTFWLLCLLQVMMYIWGYFLRKTVMSDNSLEKQTGKETEPC